MLRNNQRIINIVQKQMENETCIFNIYSHKHLQFSSPHQKQVEGVQPSNANTQSLNCVVCCESGTNRFGGNNHHQNCLENCYNKPYIGVYEDYQRKNE